VVSGHQFDRSQEIKPEVSLTLKDKLPNSSGPEHDRLRGDLLKTIASDPLFEIQTEARLTPALRKVTTDLATAERFKLARAVDTVMREEGSRNHMGEAKGYTEAVTARMVESIKEGRAAVSRSVNVFSEAELLPTLAVYASARTEPYLAHKRTVEFIEVLADTLINDARPPYAPEDAPGVSIANGGGNTGGMLVVNESAIRALGSNRNSYPARLILIPLEIDTDREMPFQITHPAALQTLANNYLGSRTHSIMAVGNSHPLQQNSCSLTTACGLGGLEETVGEEAEMFSGRKGGLNSSFNHGRRQIYVVGEDHMFNGLKQHLIQQIAIGAFPKRFGARIHFKELGEPGHSPEEIANEIKTKFEETRATPREATLRRQREKEIAPEIAEALWKQEASLLVSPLSSEPSGARRICEIAADNLYRKNIEQLAVQTAAEQIHAEGVNPKQAKDQAIGFVEKHSNSLLHLMGKLSQRPTVSILGFSDDVQSMGRHDFLTGELAYIGEKVVDELVRTGISLVLVSEGSNGVNKFIAEQFASAQERYKNPDSLLVCSRLRRNGVPNDLFGAVQTESLSAPIQSLMSRTIIRSMIGTPVANLVLGPTSPTDLRIIIQNMTDTQLGGITRSPVNGLPITPESFIVSGHYRDAPKGSYSYLGEQIQEMVKRGTADHRDTVNHSVLTSNLPEKTLDYILGHIRTYRGLT